MSSFFDKTARIIALAKSTKLPPADLGEILIHRLDQVDAYWKWVTRPKAPGCNETFALYAEMRANGHKRLLRVKSYLKEFPEINVEQDLFNLARVCFLLTKGLDGESCYQSSWADTLNEFFAVMHDYGHKLAQLNLGRTRYSDNPYLFGARGKKADMPNSDKWLEEKYGKALGSLR